MKFNLGKKLLAITLVYTFIATTSISTFANNIPNAESYSSENAIESIEYLRENYVDDITVNLKSDNSNANVAVEPVSDNGLLSSITDELYNSDMQRGNSKPTKFHDLTESNYTASITGNKVTSTYTNYYFNTDSSGEIRVDVSKIKSGADYVKISCYETNGGVVTSWSGDPDGNTIRFYNLDSDSTYYFRFQSKSILDFISGSAVVKH